MASTIFPSILPSDEDRGHDGETAGTNGTDPEATESITAQLDAGKCPWCGEEGFESARSHAATAHAADYKTWKESVGEA